MKFPRLSAPWNFSTCLPSSMKHNSSSGKGMRPICTAKTWQQRRSNVVRRLFPPGYCGVWKVNNREISYFVSPRAGQLFCRSKTRSIGRGQVYRRFPNIQRQSPPLPTNEQDPPVMATSASTLDTRVHRQPGPAYVYRGNGQWHTNVVPVKNRKH